VRLGALLLAVLVPLASASAAVGRSPADFAGTYNGSQMEVGTELRLEANGRYEYYLSYGAMDEMSEGAWAADGDAIVLTSNKYKLPVFELVGRKPDLSVNELLAILNSAGYQTLNDVLDLERDEVAQLPGMTQERADQLMALLAELTDEDSDDGRGGS